MFFVLWISSAFMAFAARLFWEGPSLSIKIRKINRVPKVRSSKNKAHDPKSTELRARYGQHASAASLVEMIEKDGAGQWPPKANHDAWPMALRPYKDIYLELSPTFAAAQPSLDDSTNMTRRNRYRSSMRQLLRERVNMAEVTKLMQAAEAGDWETFPRDAYNGFYSCIAVYRHAYRWATIPVVKVAQLEKVVDFPPELDLPWPYLQRNFGVLADSGNNTANVLHNFDERGERVYKINVGLSDEIRSSEEVFFRMFHKLEVRAVPIYYDMVYAIATFDAGDKAACVQHLKNISPHLRELLRIFYDDLRESRISRNVWLSYVQGFQGWGVGRMVDGEYVKYDGLSGNHVLFFQALDAFLGMDRYLTDQNMERYIPERQRNLCLSLKKNSIRSKITDADVEIEEEMTQIVNHLRVFRAAHRTRVMPYLEQPAPERLTMTAGKSVLETATTKTTKEALKPLEEMLATRLRETV